MTETNLQYQQISMLDDSSLITLYGISAKVLSERGMLATCRTELNRIIKNNREKHSTVNCFTPEKYYPNRGKVKRQSHHSILLDFLKEDWSELFTGDYDPEKKYYVYYHSNPNRGTHRFKKDGETITFNGRPFYIGKGEGDRYKNKKRSRSHLANIDKLLTTGYKENDIFHIFREGLEEKEALELEAKLITFFGCRNELSMGMTHFHGMKGGWLVNSDPSVRPEDVSKMMRKGKI